MSKKPLTVPACFVMSSNKLNTSDNFVYSDLSRLVFFLDNILRHDYYVGLISIREDGPVSLRSPLTPDSLRELLRSNRITSVTFAEDTISLRLSKDNKTVKIYMKPAVRILGADETERSIVVRPGKHILTSVLSYETLTLLNYVGSGMLIAANHSRNSELVRRDDPFFDKALELVTLVHSQKHGKDETQSMMTKANSVGDPSNKCVLLEKDVLYYGDSICMFPVLFPGALISVNVNGTRLVVQ